ncbi:MAG: quinolinate synthase NadA [Spirochaetes bacterium]|nr:quinolinate synthase NadA [Spirochaetota bacterium]
MTSLQDKIIATAREKNAAIYAHTYQPQEIQEISSVVADSLELARRSKDGPETTIILCGVHFMAESAFILAPHKTILLPNPDAGCPMANMINEQELLTFKAQHPGAPVVTYVNSTAAVKALSDVCCTSANALAVVKGVPSKEVIFTPDKYLGSWIQEKLGSEKIIHLYPGFCPTHQRFKEKDVLAMKAAHPSAVTLCHPEVNPGIRRHADAVMSTSQMIRYAGEHDENEFIILTEIGIKYPLEKKYPDKKFYFPDMKVSCPNMKKIALEDVLNSLTYGEHRITVPEEIREKAFIALDKMLAYK